MLYLDTTNSSRLHLCMYKGYLPEPCIFPSDKGHVIVLHAEEN